MKTNMFKHVVITVLLLFAACVNANVKKCTNASCCKQAKTAAVKLRAVQNSLVKFNKQVLTHGHSIAVTAIVNAVAPLIKASSLVIALQSPVELRVISPTLRKTLKSTRSLGTTLLKHKHNKNKVKTLATMLHNLNVLPKINNAVSTANIISSSCKLLKLNSPPKQRPPPPSSPSPPPPPSTLFIPAGAQDMPLNYANFTTDNSLNQISVVIYSTAYARASPRRSMLDAAGDMLTAALETVLSYQGPGMIKEPTNQPVNLTPDKRSALAQQQYVQNIVSLADITHEWLADDENAHVVYGSIASNTSVLQVENTLSQNLYGYCQKIGTYSYNAVSAATKQYCCDSLGNLPSNSSAIICISKIHQDIKTFMISTYAAPVFSNIGSKQSSVSSLQSTAPPTAPACCLKTCNPFKCNLPGRKILDKQDDSPSCSYSDLTNLQKGILPSVSCCFTVATNLDLCIQVSGELDVVDFNTGSNQVTVYNGIQANTYCSSQHIQADGLLHSSPCTDTFFTYQVFDDTVENAFVDVQAQLCITGGPVLDFLSDDLGFETDKLCIARLEIKYYETMKTMGFYLSVGVDIEIAGFDLAVEGELQLAYRPDLCEFVLENYDPSVYPACNMLQTHGCWWNPGDSDLEFTIMFQALGFIHKSWTWPIFTKADLPHYDTSNPLCLPAVAAAPESPPVPVEQPPAITQVGITFCANSDGKDFNTVGFARFSLSDGTVIADNVPIPSGGWSSNSVHTISQDVYLQLTNAQATQPVSVYIEWITQGHDDMYFSASIFLQLSNGVTTIDCLDSQHIGGCGDRCINYLIGEYCPTNHCPWNAPPFSISPQTVTNHQCSCH